MEQPSAPTAPPYRTRLFALFAAAAPKAVILRRGPRTHWRLITWDLRRDTFAPGQWMRGLIRLCDLSPNGEKLIYWAAQHHASAMWQRTSGRALRARPYEPLTAPALKSPKPGRRIPRYMQGAYRGTRPGPQRVTGTWTAISTPPYFTALALWPAFGHWTGGGVFRNDGSILIQEPETRMTPIENVPIPRQVRIGCWFGSGHGHNPSARWPSDPDVDLRRALTDFGASYVEFVHHDGDDLLFACDGCIYRLAGGRAAKSADDLRTAKKIADFRDKRFQGIAAPPDALRW
jgi:hypothetical protein